MYSYMSGFPHSSLFWRHACILLQVAAVYLFLLPHTLLQSILPHFVYPLIVDGHLGSFQFVSVTNTMNVLIHDFGTLIKKIFLIYTWAWNFWGRYEYVQLW